MAHTRTPRKSPRRPRAASSARPGLTGSYSFPPVRDRASFGDDLAAVDGHHCRENGCARAGGEGSHAPVCQQPVAAAGVRAVKTVLAALVVRVELFIPTRQGVPALLRYDDDARGTWPEPAERVLIGEREQGV